MACSNIQYPRVPFLAAEIVTLVIENVHNPRDLLNCACVNSIWSEAALGKLYRGSLTDPRLRTPNIAFLSYLYVASRRRFEKIMGSVKHLVISPKCLRINRMSVSSPDHNKRDETGGAMHNLQSAKHLLQRRFKDLQSLLIPFELDEVDASRSSVLDLPRTVTFLAIHHSYCDLFTAQRGPQPFVNLRALTIYHPSHVHEIPSLMDSICQLLTSCKLQIFQYESLSRVTMESLVKLMTCVQQQKNLESLALLVSPLVAFPFGRSFLTETDGKETDGKRGPLWPKLKMFYLEYPDEKLLKQLASFENLQVLSVTGPQGSLLFTRTTAWKDISTCQNLQVIELRIGKNSDLSQVRRIIASCRLLRKISVLGTYNGRGQHRRKLLLALCTLPLLEVIKLEMDMSPHGAEILDLARHCPRLAILNLFRTVLHLNPQQLKNAVVPFQNLEDLEFEGIQFHDERDVAHSDKCHEFMTEWTRVFPNVRGRPSRQELLWAEFKIEGNPPSQVGNHASCLSTNSLDPGTKELMSLYPLARCDQGRTWVLMPGVWKRLGRPISENVRQSTWDKKLEVELVGWPRILYKSFF